MSLARYVLEPVRERLRPTNFLDEPYNPPVALWRRRVSTPRNGVAGNLGLQGYGTKEL
jgi:hypothetical protein